MSGNRDPEILNIDEAAELLGVSVKTFSKVLPIESLPARKIGREWKFSRRALIDWVGSGSSLDYYGASHQDTLVPRPTPEREGQSEVSGERPVAPAPSDNHTASADTHAGSADGHSAQRRRTAGWKIEHLD